MTLIDKKSLNCLSDDMLKNLIDILIKNIDHSELKKLGYRPHHKWSKTRMITFIMKFKPTLE